MGIGTPEETAFAFEGNIGEFVPIALTNTLLTIATLGFYRFWATTREREYLWSRTRFIDDNIEWTGKGIELFFGFLIALVLFGLPFLLLNLVLQGLILQGQPEIAGVLFGAFYIFIFYLIGVAIFRGLRYRLSRTSWHGIHGGSDNPGLKYGWSYMWKNVVAYICAALLFPWAMTSLWKERWEQMSFGPHEFSSQPNWGSLMGRYMVAYLAPIAIIIGLMIVLVPMVIATASNSGSAEPPMGAIMGMAGLFLLGFYVLWPLAALVYYSAYMREVIGTMSLSTLEFDFTARTKQWVMLFLGNAGLYLVALLVAAVPIAAFGLYQQFTELTPGEDPFSANPVAYIAFIIALIIPFVLVGPFIRYRNWHFFIRHMEASGEVNLGDLTQSPTKGLKQGEGLLDAFDMGAV